MKLGKIENGGMGERLKPAVLKTVSLERGSGVRIPLPPPSRFSSDLTVRFSFLSAWCLVHCSKHLWRLPNPATAVMVWGLTRV